jgi:hypothetical protein
VVTLRFKGENEMILSLKRGKRVKKVLLLLLETPLKKIHPVVLSKCMFVSEYKNTVGESSIPSYHA